MFEKEAEEWADKNQTRGGSSSFGDITNYHDLRQGYIAGAEFGYNKANEWHYVKDGDFPPKSDRVEPYDLCERNESIPVICLTEFMDVVSGHYDFDTTSWVLRFSCRNRIIAWKEIVLPKEIKEK